MPETALGFPYPDSTDAPNVPADIEALADALDTILTLPADVTAVHASTQTVTSTTYAALSTPVSASITNPSSVYDMLVDVKHGAYMASSAASVELSSSIAATGGLTIAAGTVGGGGAISASEFPLTAGTSTAVALQSTVRYRIPAGAAAVTFAIQAKRSAASGTQIYNFAHLRIMPVRFVLP